MWGGGGGGMAYVVVVDVHADGHVVVKVRGVPYCPVGASYSEGRGFTE